MISGFRQDANEIFALLRC